MARTAESGGWMLVVTTTAVGGAALAALLLGAGGTQRAATPTPVPAAAAVATAAAPSAPAVDGETPPLMSVGPEELPPPVLGTLRERIDRGEIVWRLYRHEIGGDTLYAIITDDELLMVDPEGTVRGRRDLEPGRPQAARPPSEDEPARADDQAQAGRAERDDTATPGFGAGIVPRQPTRLKV